MSTNTYRFHVNIGQTKRSTVSFPKYLLTMFSLKQGWSLEDPKDLHKKIREWCNKALADGGYNEHAINYSQFLQEKMIEFLLDKNLSIAFDNLFVNKQYEKIRF